VRQVGVLCRFGPLLRVQKRLSDGRRHPAGAKLGIACELAAWHRI